MVVANQQILLHSKTEFFPYGSKLLNVYLHCVINVYSIKFVSEVLHRFYSKQHLFLSVIDLHSKLKN